MAAPPVPSAEDGKDRSGLRRRQVDKSVRQVTAASGQCGEGPRSPDGALLGHGVDRPFDDQREQKQVGGKARICTAAHRSAIEGWVDVVHERVLFDLGRFRTFRAAHRTDDPLDARTAALIVQDMDVFESDQGLEDLTRVSDNESASCSFWLIPPPILSRGGAVTNSGAVHEVRLFPDTPLFDQ